MNRSFDPLCNGAPARLNALRTQVGTSWRAPESGYRVKNLIGANVHPFACPGFNGSTPILSSFDAAHLPVRSGSVRYADKVRPRAIEYRGWFADAESQGNQGVIRGFIAAISHGRFLAGHHWSDNGEWVLYCDTAYTDAGAAAHAADEHARVYAEQCQESDARFQAMSRAEGLVEDHTADAQDAIAARNTSPRNRQWARDAIENLRQSRKELAEATETYERT